MLAEVLSIGNEVISGRILDTNAQWLSRRLEELGYRVRYHSAVGDDLDDIVAAFRRAVGRVELVVATGGLGPTADDLTRDALAAAFGMPLEINTEALDQIRELFKRRRREMPSRNELQARFPLGACPVRNPNGTAPGIELDVLRSELSPLPYDVGRSDATNDLPAGRGRCRIICLPGVPAEIAEMWDDSVARRLREHNALGLRIVHKQIKCFGAGESQIEAMLPEGFVRQTDPQVGINASATTIIFRISAQAATEEECRAKIAPVVETLYATLGPLVFGEDDDELETVVCRLLADRGETVGVIDCGNGGLVGERLGAVVGSSGGFRGACAPATADALAHIAEHFGLAADLIDQIVSCAAVPSDSPEPSAVAAALAQAARLLWNCDWGLAVSPLPAEGPSASPPRPFAVAVADENGVQAKELPYAGHPAWLRTWISKQALNTLRLALLRR